MRQSEIKAYYEANTKRFLKFGQNGATKAIHQPLWAGGVYSLDEALNYSNELIIKEIQTFESPIQILDLGCGVGSSIQYINKQTASKHQFYGVTISATQVQIAQKLFQNQRIEILENNFLELDPKIQNIDVAYCIEAFIHASSAQDFFASVAPRLKPGGKLIIIDDIITYEHNDAKTTQLLEQFANGWHAGKLSTLKETIAAAKHNSLIHKETISLNPYLKIGRLRDKFIRIYTQLFNPFIKNSYYFSMLKGGAAKQQLIKSGDLTYSYLLFEKN